MDPLDKIRSICAEQPHDALSQIAAVLGFDDAQVPAMPEGWTLIEKKTCYALMHDGAVIATLAGPDSEANAAIIATAIHAHVSGASVANDGPDHGDGCARFGHTPETCPSRPRAPDYKIAYDEWIEKTEFVREWISSGKLPVKYLGWHHADIMRDLIEHRWKLVIGAPAADGDARDAARYRFIRDVPYCDLVRNVMALQQNAIMDETIDAAIQRNGDEK